MTQQSDESESVQKILEKTLVATELSFLSLEELLPSFDPVWYRDEEASGCFSPSSIINGTEARALAHLIIDDHGHIDEARLAACVSYVEKHQVYLGTGAEELLRRRKKILSSLLFLVRMPQVKQFLHRLGRPYGNKMAELAIKQTLLLDETSQITEVETRKAVLVAFLGTLRQSLGSCFATAPAIIVHEHQSMVFLENLEELFATSRLRKVVAGQELLAPQNMGWGEGDLRRSIGISPQMERNSQPFWRSKTLLQALLHVGLIESMPLNDQEAFHLFLPAIVLLRKKELTTFIAMKEILLALVLLHFDVQWSDYEQFIVKTQSMLAHQEIEMKAVPVNSKSPYAHKLKQCRLAEEMYDALVRFLTCRTDIALLKMWEYTIASFAEVKLGMCRNNFYISLGVNWDEEGGVGQLVYEEAKQKVDEANRLVEDSRQQYDALNVEMSLIEGRLRSASTEKELQWLKSEHLSRQAEQYHLRQQCDIAVERANKIAHLHELLLEQYDRLLKEYFQEIYDPDLHEVQTGLYDDSPAGFRLLYKHGRSHSALWTVIRSLEEWRDALASFFSITEQELLVLPELQNVEEEVRHITSRLVGHIRSDYFVETALKRYSRAYGVPCPEYPLQHLDQVEKKPWVYTSGGSMSSLVEAYFAKRGPPEESDRWVENETELFAYLIDTVRLIQKRISNIPPASVLMHSPTHAFVLLPHHMSFKESWQSDTYSYTWIKKTVLDPSLSFYSSYAFDHDVTNALNEQIVAFLDPQDARYLIKELTAIPAFLRAHEYAQEMMRLFQREAYLRSYEPMIRSFDWDRFFFSHLPYLSLDQVHSLLLGVEQKLFSSKYYTSNKLFETVQSIGRYQRVFSKKECILLLKALLIEREKRTSSEKNLLEEALVHIQTMFSMPARPVIFADTNWMKEYFAFAMSPTSLSLKLWTCNSLGTEGGPIFQWAPWLDGSRKDRTWGVFINPEDYTMQQQINLFLQQPAGGKQGLQYFHE